MAQWHQEDEKWLKARAAAAFEAKRRYNSVEASMDRMMERARALAYTELMFELERAECARRRRPQGPAMD